METAIKWDVYNTETKPIMVFDEYDVHQGIEAEYGIVDRERTYPLTKYYIFLFDVDLIGARSQTTTRGQ